MGDGSCDGILVAAAGAAALQGGVAVTDSPLRHK